MTKSKLSDPSVRFSYIVLRTSYISPTPYSVHSHNHTITMFAARRLANIPRVRAQASLFHSTAPAFVQKGDAIPNLDVLVENSPGNKVNLAKEIKNKAVIIGTPAAFSA